MPKYGTQVTNFTTSATSTTVIRLMSVSNRRCEIVEAIMTGAGAATPADVGHDCHLVHITSSAIDGVATALQAAPFVRSSAAATGSVAGRFTVEPTTYDTMYQVYFGFNQRGGQRWSVPQGEGMKVDSGTASGTRMGMRNQSSAAGNCNASLNWWED